MMGLAPCSISDPYAIHYELFSTPMAGFASSIDCRSCASTRTKTDFYFGDSAVTW